MTFFLDKNHVFIYEFQIILVTISDAVVYFNFPIYSSKLMPWWNCSE